MLSPLYYNLLTPVCDIFIGHFKNTNIALERFLQVACLSCEPSQSKILTTNDLLHGARSFLWNKQLLSHTRNSQHFVEPERSLLCSWGPTTVPYSDPESYLKYITLIKTVGTTYVMYIVYVHRFVMTVLMKGFCDIGISMKLVEFIFQNINCSSKYKFLWIILIFIY
jgi:hypothetical protein